MTLNSFKAWVYYMCAVLVNANEGAWASTVVVAFVLLIFWFFIQYEHYRNTEKNLGKI